VNLPLGPKPSKIDSIRTLTISQQLLPEKPKKRKLWDVDPSIFKPGRKASFYERRIVPPLRQIGKFGLYSLAISYPLYLVYVGLAFGGLAFWGFLAGSMALMGIIIARLGYSSNFRNWDTSLKRTLGLILGFLLAIGFYGGLIYLKTWFLPIGFGLAGVGLLLMLRRSTS
jgi:hypothetical protein